MMARPTPLLDISPSQADLQGGGGVRTGPAGLGVSRAGRGGVGYVSRSQTPTTAEKFRVSELHLHGI